MDNSYTVYICAVYMLYTMYYIPHPIYTIYAIYHPLFTKLYMVSCDTLYYMVVSYTWAILSGHHQPLCSTHGDTGHGLHIQ